MTVEHRVFLRRAAVGGASDQLHGLRHRQPVDQHALADTGVAGCRDDLRPECVGRTADFAVGGGIVLVAGRAAWCGAEDDGSLLDQPGDFVQQFGTHGLQLGQYEYPIPCVMGQCQHPVCYRHVALDHFCVDVVELVAFGKCRIGDARHFGGVLTDEIGCIGHV